MPKGKGTAVPNNLRIRNRLSEKVTHSLPLWFWLFSVVFLILDDRLLWEVPFYFDFPPRRDGSVKSLHASALSPPDAYPSCVTTSLHDCTAVHLELPSRTTQKLQLVQWWPPVYMRK